MKRLILSALPLLASVSFATAQTGQADLITFEPDSNGYLPNGTLAKDELRISDQYQASHGVRFGLDANFDRQIDPGSFVLLEKTGGSDSNNGFTSTNGVSNFDSAAPGYESQLGNWFVKTNANLLNSTFLIAYDNPVSAASGELWDIDGRSSASQYERLAVTAYGANGQVLGKIESPIGLKPNAAGSLDSKPWLWSFDFGTSNLITAIGIRSIGTVNGPLGFNNFAASTAASLSSGASMATPELSFPILAGSFLALGALGIRRRPVG